LAGLWGFGITSLLCALAPNGVMLILARALQGAAGALLVPSSLALIISAFSGAAQGKAIGSWTAWTGIAFVVGPLVGGSLIQAFSWRLIFAINVVPVLLTSWLMRSMENKKPAGQRPKVDAVGALACAIGLGGSVYALIEQSHYGWSSPLIFGPLAVGIAALGYFVWHERRTPQPMVPLDLFAVRNFAFGNIATFAIYAGLSIASFLITIFVQQFGGYSALNAGLALLPVTLIMFVLSPRAGTLAGRYGPRLFMTFGPLLGAVGFFLLLRVDRSVNYWTQILPGICFFGLGLAVTVAPLTAAVLGSIASEHAGIGSAINNAVARIAGLLAIAGLGLIVGPTLDISSFHHGAVAMALLLVLGGIVSAVGIRNNQVVQKESATQQ